MALSINNKDICLLNKSDLIPSFSDFEFDKSKPPMLYHFKINQDFLATYNEVIFTDGISFFVIKNKFSTT